MDAMTLSAAAGISVPRAELWALPLTAAMNRFNVTTALRQACFIAQTGHESLGFALVREIWNPKQVPAQARYEGRADLGNTQPGDGMRFMGRGLIQIAVVPDGVVVALVTPDVRLALSVEDQPATP